METKPRVTRAERQAQTRERLIEVARRTFLDDGYAATSLEKVAVEAGFSKGAVYSNFQGKEELCLAVLDEIHGELIDGVIEAFSGEADIDVKLKSFLDWARVSLGEPKWTALLVEFAAVARSNEWVATELIRRQRDVTTAIAELIRYVTADTAIAPRTDPDEVAMILFSLGIGVGALRSLDPELDVEVFAATLRHLIR